MNEDVIEYIKDKLDKNFDLVSREIGLEAGQSCLFYLKSICNDREIGESIIKPMINSKVKTKSIEGIIQNVLAESATMSIKDKDAAVQHLLSGYVVMVYDFCEGIIGCDVKKMASRNIEIPPAEAVLKGPREGFTENIMINISLIRKRLPDEDLKIELIKVGEKANIPVVLCYINHVTPDDLVSHVKKQINKIQSEFVIQANYITEHLQTRSSAFNTVGATEKPDVFVAKIVEGRVGILLQGDPSALTVPYFFIETFQSPNDYTMNIWVGNYTRVVRWISFVVAILVPPLYIALTTHHYSLVPRMLAFRLAISRAGVPFPTVIEFILLMFFFQLLREAGVRLPAPIGQSISIVGALILGDAAVQSGLASTITVLLTALSSISTYLLPDISIAIVLWTNFLIITSTFFGLPGFFIGFAVLCTHLASITSCGYPYLFPLGTLSRYKSKDIIIRGFLQDITNSSFTKEDEE